jgi:hypothetical protein
MDIVSEEKKETTFDEVFAKPERHCSTVLYLLSNIGNSSPVEFFSTIFSDHLT